MRPRTTPWLLALALAGPVARAQSPRRLSIQVEPAVGTMLAGPRVERYGLGLAGSLRAGLQLYGPVSVHALLGAWLWDNSQPGQQAGSLRVVGAGLRLGTRPGGPGGHGAIDLEGGAGFTGSGSAALTRAFLGLGVAWLFPLTTVVEVGPALRYGRVFQPSTPTDSADASFWTLGVVVGFHTRDPVDPGPAGRTPPPPADRDHDGLPDGRDRCPAEPEDHDGFRDDDGCPDPDNDDDGIPDNADACIDIVENINGFQDDDGCPDRPPVLPPAVPLPSPVHFDAGSAVLRVNERPRLLGLVQVLNAHPEVHRLRVEGHADAASEGDADQALRLSEARAYAVHHFLLAHGIVPSRVVVRAQGVTRPGAGAAENRRVEFVVEE